MKAAHGGHLLKKSSQFHPSVFICDRFVNIKRKTLKLTFPRLLEVIQQSRLLLTRNIQAKAKCKFECHTSGERGKKTADFPKTLDAFTDHASELGNTSRLINFLQCALASAGIASLTTPLFSELKERSSTHWAAIREGEENFHTNCLICCCWNT